MFKTKTCFLLLTLTILLAACGSAAVSSPTQTVTEAAASPTVEAVSPTATANPFGTVPSQAVVYPIVDTGQSICYDSDGQNISCPAEGDLAVAARTLGVTEEALQAALGDPTQGPPDFAAAAQTLGVSEAELMAALGIPEGGAPARGPEPTSRP